MKTIIYSFLCIVTTLVGCAKMPTTNRTTPSDDNATLSLNFQCETMDVISTTTKALPSDKEKEVKDLNIYLINNEKGFVKHEFIISDSPLTMNIPKGEYDIHVLANYGSDMGMKTKFQVEMLAPSINDETELQQDSVLLMSAKQTVTINENTSVSIVLKRMVAKISVMINTSSFQGFTLKSITLINAPRSCRVSVPNVSLSGMKYASRKSAFLDFYMFENTQGVNQSITSQQEKSKRKAPPQATYFQIIGSYNDYEVEYSIYLGENNTTDFNIYRNKTYLYLIDIKGMDEIDTRVKSVYMTLSPFNESTIIGKSATSDISLIRTGESTNQYSLAYFLDEGEGLVYLNGLEQNEGVFIPFLNKGEMAKNATLTYMQGAVSPVRLRIVCKDEDNFIFSRELFTNYVSSKLDLNIMSATESKGGGTSTVSFTISKEGFTGNVRYKYELLMGAGTVKAGPLTLTEDVYQNGIIGKQAIQFTPTSLADAAIRITVLLGNGETMYKDVIVKVSKTTIQITRTNGNGVQFSVSDSKWYNSSTKKYTLPTNFGATINLKLNRSTSSQYNREIANHNIKPNSILEFRDSGGAICTWSGLYSEVVDGISATYTFDVSTNVSPNKFYQLIINK